MDLPVDAPVFSVEEEHVGSPMELLHLLDDCHRTLPTAGRQRAMLTAISSTTVEGRSQAHSNHRGLVQLSRLAFAMVYHEIGGLRE